MNAQALKARLKYTGKEKVKRFNEVRELADIYNYFLVWN